MVALTSALTGRGGQALATESLRAAPQPTSHGVPEAGQMRPVPKFAGTSLRDPHRATQQPRTTQQLQWRTSSEVSPPPASAVAPQAATATTQPTPQAARTAAAAATVAVASAPVAASSPTIPAGSPRNVATTAPANPIRQVQLETPQSPQSPQTPQPGLQLPPALEAPPTADRALPDFFADPFGERGVPTPGMPDAPATDTLPPPLMLPPAQPPQAENDLREPTQPAEPVPLFPEPETSPFELRPMPTPGIEDDQPRREIEDFELPRRDRRPAAPVAPEEDMTLIRPVAFSCDDFRASIADAKIQKLSLDISPPFRPDVIELDEFRRLKQQFSERQESRDWQSIDGRKLGRGRMRDLAYENVVIETDFGTLEELPVNRLSEADLTYISSQWGLPQECLIDQPEYQGRSWIASQITWKASNLIHKPLYFEDVNLERYGHTAGPFLQPVVSSAHFFVNIAVMPYKMGVHSPHECQYPLGYYRPGNCAPWITPPVPLSLRGALFQAGAMTGNFLLVP